MQRNCPDPLVSFLYFPSKYGDKHTLSKTAIKQRILKMEGTWFPTKAKTYKLKLVIKFDAYVAATVDDVLIILYCVRELS